MQCNILEKLLTNSVHVIPLTVIGHYMHISQLPKHDRNVIYN